MYINVNGGQPAAIPALCGRSVRVALAVVVRDSAQATASADMLAESQLA
ncbi:hypothetical protein [Cryobacterium sp. Y82]|nr:hypothetical protein [Cryobacterium sp. Y82]